MKKSLFILAAAVLALASCGNDNKQGTDPVKDAITLKGSDVVDLEENNFYTVEFNATTDWTAEFLFPEAGEPYASLDVMEGKKGDAKVKLTVESLEEGTGRFFMLYLTAGEATATIFFMQGKVLEWATEEGSSEIPAEGGIFKVRILTNCDVVYKKYDGEGESFPFAPVTIDKDAKTITFDVKKNESYDERQAYVKLTTSDIKDGEDDYVVRIYVNQAGLKCVAYTVSMYDAYFDTWGTTVLSEAVYNGNHFVSNGQDLYKINPADGKYEKIDWPWGSGMTQKVITNDDAGNLIVCNHTAYTDVYLDGYFILNVVTPAGAESNLITKAAWECGGPFGANLRVTGDITSNAMIVAPVEGISGVTMSSTVGYWQVLNGSLSDYGTLAVTGIAGTWSCAAWNTYPNNFPTIIANTADFNDGFIMSGCYEDNNIYSVASDGAASILLEPILMVDGYDLSENLAYQSMDIRTISGTKYMVVMASPHFPSYGPGWSGAPYIALHELDGITAGDNIFEAAKFTRIVPSYFPWEDDPATDWAISVAADVMLYDAGANIGMAYADLNGRCFGAFEIVK